MESLSYQALFMTQVTFYVFLSRWGFSQWQLCHTLFLVFFNIPWFVLFCCPSLFHCSLSLFFKQQNFPCSLQGSFVTTMTMDESSSSWSLSSRDHQHFQIAAGKCSFNLCYYIPVIGTYLNYECVRCFCTAQHFYWEVQDKFYMTPNENN